MIELVAEFWHTIDSIAIDAVVHEQHLLSGEVTEHPVEEGANVADHFRQAPRAVQLEGVITDTPIYLPPSHNNGARPTQRTFDIPNEAFGMQLGPIPISISGVPSQGAVTTFSAQMTRVQSTWDAFKEIYRLRKAITIVTALETYPDMQLRDLTVDMKGKSYTFSCFAMQVRTVSSGRVQAAPVPAVTRAKPRVDKGKQGTKPVVAPEQPNKTLAKQIVVALVGNP